MKFLVALVAIAFCLGVGFVWRDSANARFEERVRTESLRADSTEAARDSGRAVRIALLGDSVRLYQRRILQMHQRSDSVDRALGLERATRFKIAAEVTELRTQTSATVTAEPDDARSASFRARDGPFHIDALATLPRAPGDGQMTLRVAIDTALIEARIGCGPAGAAGVSPATLSVVGPKWMALRLGQLEQEPRVCSPGEPPQRQTRERLAARIAHRIRLGVGYGAVLAPDGRVIRGPAATAIWSIWP